MSDRRLMVNDTYWKWLQCKKNFLSLHYLHNAAGQHFPLTKQSCGYEAGGGISSERGNREYDNYMSSNKHTT